ncbi:hypothetical protein UlMin_040302 [Ulmus minor]
MEDEGARKKPLELDWDKLLPNKDDDPQPLLVVKSNSAAPETRKESVMAGDRKISDKIEAIEKMSDHELVEKIRSSRKSLQSYGRTLPDKGEKLKLLVKQFEEEMERRKRRRVETIRLEEDGGSEKPTKSISSNIEGGTEDLSKENKISQTQTQSSFASCFLQKMERKTDCRTANAFAEDLSLLGPCNNRKMRNRKEFSHKDRRTSARLNSSNGNPNSRASSTYSLRHIKDNFYAEKKDAEPSNVSRPRKGQTIDLEDDEEPQFVEAAQQVEKPDECMKEKEAWIYYPCSDDPEAVEISYADVECLAPETYLRSAIMNFYIRYLQEQASPTNRAICDCHFFNTYFYNKLKEAVSRQGSSNDYFVKFRRWWKGVNIFQKAYLLIPICEDQHWSLVIICIPDKEQESGPIILHLDSLGFHYSRAVFLNIKNFLKEEWRYLTKEVTHSDFPFVESIWKNLPSKILTRSIEVPQQKNDYDCGLFVLFFMERFIKDAPGRLKRKDLAMFGRDWFIPEEASSLRKKIQNLLKDLKKASKVDCTAKSSPPSLSAAIEL